MKMFEVFNKTGMEIKGSYRNLQDAIKQADWVNGFVLYTGRLVYDGRYQSWQ